LVALVFCGYSGRTQRTYAVNPPESIPKAAVEHTMKTMNSNPAPSTPGFLVALGLGLASLGGCSTQQFYANYYLDPKPAKLSYDDLKPVANPRPVYLVFDMYSAEGSFPEATRKLAPKIVHVLDYSRLFSSVSKVGSENMARIQISMRETAVLSGQDAKSLPDGLTSGLRGSQGVIIYQFTASYQPPGKEIVKKVYPHAIHIVKGSNPALGDALPMTASHAVDAMIEQVVLHFLRDLQNEGKL